MNFTALAKIYEHDNAGVTIGIEEKNEELKVRNKFGVLEVNKEKRKAYFDKLTEEERNDMIKQAKEGYAKRVEIQKKEILDNTKKPTYTRSSLQKILDTVDKERKKQGLPSASEKPKLKEIPSSERSKRRGLYEKYAPEYTEFILKTQASDKLVDILDNSPNNYSRGTARILNESDPEKIEQTMANYGIIEHGTDNEKRDLLDKKLGEYIKLTEDLQDAKTDEQFMKALDGRYKQLIALTELQPTSMDNIIKDFGVEPSKEVYDRFKELQNQMVDTGGFLSRVSAITSPQYAEIDIDDIEKVNLYMSSIGSKLEKISIEQINDDVGWKDGSVVNGNITQLRKDDDVEFDTLKDLAESAKFTSDNIVKTRLKGRIEVIAKKECGLENEDVKCKDLTGKDLTVDEAAAKMYEGKHVDICDKEGNIYRRIKADDRVWGNIDGDKDYSINLEDATENDIKTEFNNLAKEIDKTTHLFMRSSEEFREFRRQFNELRQGDLSDKEEVKRRMKEVSKAATAYLILKEKPNTKITGNTEPRIKIAEKISNMFERSLSQDKTLQKDEGKEKSEENLISETKSDDRTPLYKVDEKFEDNVIDDGKEVDEESLTEEYGSPEKSGDTLENL